MPLNPDAPGVTPAALENIIRPFLNTPGKPDRTRKYTRGRQNTIGVVDTEGEEIPTLSWTAAVRTEVTTLPAQSVSVKLNPPDDDDEAEDEELPDYDEEEVSVIMETVRIYNPDDNQQYVDVERVKEIVFRDKNLRTIRRMVLANRNP